MKKITINNFEECLYYEKLDNGLEVYLFPSPDKNIYVGSLGTKYGGMNTNFVVDGKEYEVPLGTAHFLEHKVFEQEEGDSPLRFFAKTGSEANAMTSGKLTRYYFSCCDNWIPNLKYLIDYVSNIYLTEENIDKERGIISEEIRMYEDDPDSVIYETIIENTFLNDSIRNSVSGTINDIMSITKEDLELCYHTFYQPSNMILVVGGPIDVHETLKTIKEEFNGKNHKNTKFECILKSDSNEKTKAYQELVMDTINPKFAFSIKMKQDKFNGLSKYELDYYLSMILSIGIGGVSDFYEHARKDNLMYYFRPYCLMGENHIAIIFIGESEEPLKFIDRLKNELTNLKSDQVSFERMKKAWIASEIRSIDSVYSVVANVFHDINDYGEYKNNKIEDIRNLNYDVLLSVIDNISIEHTATVLILPEKK